ncbi:MAG: hypothetical protein Q9184_005012 [Pyrenodesmia sp. 2 TL-2023]
MYYSTFALLLLSAPFLTEAGPVSSVDKVDDYSVNLPGRAIEPALGILKARADDDDSCTTRDKCLETGTSNWDALVTKLKDDSATDVDQYDGKLETDYVDNVTPDVTPNGDAFKDLFQKVLHFDFNAHFATHAVSGNEGGTEAYVNMFNTNQGTLVNEYNDKSREDKKLMPFSEVVFQCYKKECDEIQELKKFQFAAVANVANQEYLAVIDDIYDRNQLNKYGPRADEWIKWTYEGNRDDFLAFLGTPKIGYILRMLKDHSNAFGKRIPTEVHTNKWRNALYVIIDEYKA